MYHISSHTSRTFKVKFRAQNKGCDLYSRCKYNGSHLPSIPDIWAKIMGATYMRMLPICKDIRYVKVLTEDRFMPS